MLVLSGGRVIDPSSGLDAQADLVIEGETISRLGKGAGSGLSSEKIETFDASGCWVVPGLIDLHAHLREPGQEYKETIESGLAAAAAGGYVAVCSMPNTRPVNDNRTITEAVIAAARECDGPKLYPFGAITKGSRGEELTEMADLREAGAVGVSDDGHCVTNAAVMRRALEYARTFDLLVSQHCEDHDLTQGAQMHEGEISTRLGLRGWPREAEEIIVARDLILVEATGARYHVAHVSSAGAVRLIREAKSRGLRVSAEVTPHHLVFTHEALEGYDTQYKVNPPLREAADREALREALREGVIDCIATDHAPHSSLEKDCEFAAASPGIIGLELALPLALDLVREGFLSPARLVESLSTAPARVARVDGGTLGEGSRANVTVIDPEKSWKVEKTQLRSRSANTPLLGKELLGAAVATIVDGRIVYQR